MQQTMENVLTMAVIAKNFKKNMTLEEEVDFAIKYNEARSLDIDACNIQVKLMLGLVEETLKKDISRELRSILLQRKNSLENGQSRDVIFQITPYLKRLCEEV